MDAQLAAAFNVRIDGIGEASFSRVSGLSAQVGVVEYREGGSDAPRLFPGDVRWEPLVFERGWVQDPRLWDWFERRDARAGTVEVLKPDGAVAGRFTFRRGWPARWSGPSFDANSSQIALEVLEIVHEGLEWEMP